MFRPKGINVAMMTPFKDGKVFEKSVRQMVEFDVQNGVNGIFPVSSGGEFIQMDFAEKVRLMSIVKDQVGNRAAVMPGVTSPNPKQSIALAKEAEKLGCDAVVMAPPYYLPLSQGMVEAHYREVAAAINIPIVLYNIPAFTTGISEKTMVHLCEVPNIVAMKDSTGSMERATHMVDMIHQAGRSDTFSFMTGREDAMLPLLALGGVGSMTGAACIAPETMVGLYNAFQAGDYALAQKYQADVLPMIRAWQQLPLVVGLKTAMEVRGFDMGELMQPLAPDEIELREKVRAQLKDIMAGFLGDKLIVDVNALA